MYERTSFNSPIHQSSLTHHSAFQLLFVQLGLSLLLLLLFCLLSTFAKPRWKSWRERCRSHGCCFFFQVCCVAFLCVRARSCSECFSGMNILRVLMHAILHMWGLTDSHNSRWFWGSWYLVIMLTFCRFPASMLWDLFRVLFFDVHYCHNYSVPLQYCFCSLIKI